MPPGFGTDLDTLTPLGVNRPGLIRKRTRPPKDILGDSHPLTDGTQTGPPKDILGDLFPLPDNECRVCKRRFKNEKGVRIHQGKSACGKVAESPLRKGKSDDASARVYINHSRAGAIEERTCRRMPAMIFTRRTRKTQATSVDSSQSRNIPPMGVALEHVHEVVDTMRVTEEIAAVATPEDSEQVSEGVNTMRDKEIVADATPEVQKSEKQQSIRSWLHIGYKHEVKTKEKTSTSGQK